MTSSLMHQPFGTLPCGRSVEIWTLNGAGGLVLEVLTYGGIVRRLLVPDGNGKKADVVLGFNELGAYLGNHPYFGAIAGRVAGRITDGRFRLEGKSYELARNNPPNHLHGGVEGFDKKIWTAAPRNRPDGAPSLSLSYLSQDGEEGYPGNVVAKVTYSVLPENVFVMEIEATADRPTPLSLTQHSYFNLAGENAGAILDHELQIDADEVALADENLTLLGRRKVVAGEPCDFRQPKTLGFAIPGLLKNHGDLYFIRREAGSLSKDGLAPVARLVHPASGRVLTVESTESCFQLYTGAYLDGELIGKSGVPYGKHAGVCLECEGYPNGVNNPDLGDIVLRPGRAFRQITAYAFSNLPV